MLTNSCIVCGGAYDAEESRSLSRCTGCQDTYLARVDREEAFTRCMDRASKALLILVMMALSFLAGYNVGLKEQPAAQFEHSGNSRYLGEDPNVDGKP
jgi:hypothetical protein